MSNHPSRRHRRRRPVRPARAEIDALVRIETRRLGCTCPEVDIANGHGPVVQVAHDDGCPAQHAGLQPPTLIIRGHLR